jgi:hypothetical protein
MGMFDELAQWKAAPKAEKRLTEEEEKMEVAVRAFVIAERRFKKLDEHPRKVSDSKINLAWWNALEDMYCCDRALWDMFTGPDKSMQSNKQYAQFRSRLLTGVPVRADA